MDNENLENIEPVSTSILTDIKKLLGITQDYTHFDPDLTIHINSVFSILTQLGVGPETGFAITGEDETWADYLSAEQIALIEMVKSYIYLKVRLMFDPPMNTTVTESINKLISELESRLIYVVDKWPPEDNI